MEHITEICRADTTLFKMTPYKIVHLEDEAEINDATIWWRDLTGKGGEGMVVKPYDFIAYGKDGGILQPAVKCRGREYLRIIYGPEYCEEGNLSRLKKRGLAKKRALAVQEFALGIDKEAPCSDFLSTRESSSSHASSLRAYSVFSSKT